MSVRRAPIFILLALAGCLVEDVESEDQEANAFPTDDQEILGKLFVTTTQGQNLAVAFWEQDGIAYIDTDITIGPIEDALRLAEEQAQRGSTGDILGLIPLGRTYANGIVTYSLDTSDFAVDDVEGWVDVATCEARYELPPGSPYTTDTEMCEDMRRIRDAMDHWTDKVPSISFTEFDTSLGHTTELLFQSDSNCSYGTTYNNINMGTCNTWPKMAHEIGHALGMQHEHQTSEACDAFDTRKTIAHTDWWCYGFASETPLDYGSLMLYDSFDGTDDFEGTPDYVEEVDGDDIVMVISDAVYSGAFYQDFVAAGCDRGAHESDIPHVPDCAAPFQGHTVDVTCWYGEGEERDEDEWESVLLEDLPVYEVDSRPGVAVSFEDCFGVMANPPGDPGQVTEPPELLEQYFTVNRHGIDGQPHQWRDGWDYDSTNQSAWENQRDQLSPLDVSTMWPLYEAVLEDGGPPAYGEEYGSVIVHGDFDWDGLMDMAVGVPEDASGLGSVVVYKGVMRDLSGETSFMRWRTIQGTAGIRPWSVAVGDLNDDGYDDLVVGHDNGTTAGGEVLIFLGEDFPTFDRTAAWSISTSPTVGTSWWAVNLGTAISGWSPGSGAKVGRSLAIGDLDFDGIDDLVIGAPNANARSPGFIDPGTYSYTDSPYNGIEDVYEGTGAVLVLKGQGGSGSPVVPSSLRVVDPYDWGVPGSRVGAEFGHSVAIGNLNSDQCLDVIVGAPEDYLVDWVMGWGNASVNPLPNNPSMPTAVHVGQVYLFKGLPTSATACDWSFASLEAGTLNQEGSEFGFVVESGPVVNTRMSGDHDVVVGAPGADTAEDPTVDQYGAVYVFEGGSPELFDGDPTLADEPDHEYSILSQAATYTCPARDQERFGHEVVLGYFEEWRGKIGTSQPDTDEVAVGVPYRDADCGGDPLGSGEGAVYTYSGYDAAVPFAPRDEYLAPYYATNVGALWGVALSYKPEGHYLADTADDYQYGMTSLWIGAPGADTTTSIEVGAAFSIDGDAIGQY